MESNFYTKNLSNMTKERVEQLLKEAFGKNPYVIHEDSNLIRIFPKKNPLEIRVQYELDCEEQLYCFDVWLVSEDRYISTEGTFYGLVEHGTDQAEEEFLDYIDEIKNEWEALGKYIKQVEKTCEKLAQIQRDAEGFIPLLNDRSTGGSCPIKNTILEQLVSNELHNIV